jgi:hypothetical protein
MTPRALEAGSAVKEIDESCNGQASGFEDRLEGFRLQNFLAMHGNGHAMSKAVTYSTMEVEMATFLIEYHETSPAERLNGVLSGDPRETGHLHRDLKRLHPLRGFLSFQQDVLPGDRAKVQLDGLPDVFDSLFPCVTFADAARERRAGHSVAIPPVSLKNYW